MNLKKHLSIYFSNTVLLFLILSIIPFLILSIYVNPSWDDFDYSEFARENGFFKSQLIWYETWSGRYFSTAVLSSLNPLLLRSMTGYKITILLFIFLFITAVYLLVSETGKDNIGKRQKIILTLSFCYLFFYGLPTLDLALYWLASTVIYQLANILTIILIMLMIRFSNRGHLNPKPTLILFICLLIFAIEGSNEVSMLITTIFFVVTFILNTLTSRRFNKYLFLFAVVSVISFCLMYFAPGNEYRLSTNPNSHQLIFSIRSSASDLFKFILYRIYNLPLLIFTVLFISFYSKFILSKKSGNITLLVNPVYSIALYLLLLGSGIFVSYWSLGTSTPFRTLNVIYFVFLTGWFLNIVIILNYYYVNHKIKIDALPKYAAVILCSVILFSFLKEANSIKAAYKDLLSGAAQLFDSELKQRYDKIYSDNSDTCRIDSLTLVPKSFFYFDIGSDPEGKYNKLQSQFFGKKAILMNK